jgi:hypothetical protein
MSDCIEAGGSPNNSGYHSTRYKGKRIGAHRAAWMEANNAEIPEGLHVMHSCDNRKCINPEHLSLGTRYDNMRDCAAKGRVHSPCRVLSDEQQRYVLESPLNSTELAKEMPCTARNIRNYRRRMGQVRPRGGQGYKRRVA